MRTTISNTRSTKRRWPGTNWFAPATAARRSPRSRNHPPNLLILDHILAAGELGLEFLPEFKELLPFVPIIIVSGALEVQQQMKALQGPRRAHYCLPKPVDVHELCRTVDTALKECGETRNGAAV